jgi:hypothetical protein
MHKAISLSAEMAEIRNAVEGARFLADELATGGMEDRKRELQAPLTISAILVLVELRLHQVERVLRGEEDPLLLWAIWCSARGASQGRTRSPRPGRRHRSSPCRARRGGLARRQRLHPINPGMVTMSRPPRSRRAETSPTGNVHRARGNAGRDLRILGPASCFYLSWWNLGRAAPEHQVCCGSGRGVPQVAPERKKSPEAVAPSCAKSERANTGYGHQEGVAVGHPGPEMDPSRWAQKS